MDAANYPWKQKPGEPNDLFEYFEFYVNMQSHRSLKFMAKYYHKSLRSLAYYSKKWDWVRRARLHDEYVKANIKYFVLDFIEKREAEKFEAQFNIAIAHLNFLDYLNSSLIKFEDLYDNPVAVRKIKFLKEVSQTIQQFMRMADFSLDKKWAETKLFRDMNIEQILNMLPADAKNFIHNDFNSINLVLNKFEQITDRESTGLIKMDENDATSE